MPFEGNLNSSSVKHLDWSQVVNSSLHVIF